MKVLVTGATGFIGNHVIPALLNNGCTVIATSANADKARQVSWFSRVSYIPFNFEEFDNSTDYYSFFQSPDAIIHLAWEGLPNYKASFHTEVNLPRHFSFLNNLVTNGMRNVTVTGTCFEYGMQEGMLTEDMPAKPANPYAEAKDTLRKNLQHLQQQQPFHLKWVRLFYMYGKGQNPKSLLSQLETAVKNGDARFNMSGGEQLRDYLPVETVADYIVKIALQNKVDGIINCCSGQPISVKDFVQHYLTGIRATIQLNLGYYPYPDYEPMAFWGSNKKLKTIIGNE